MRETLKSLDYNVVMMLRFNNNNNNNKCYNAGGSVIFAALHGMQMLWRILCVWLSNRLSVRLSVKRVNCDKRKKDLSRFLYHTNGNLA